jgi:UDP-N-acetylmuramoylalanine--D-glutamate ligase
VAAKEKISLLITFGASGKEIASQAEPGLSVERFEKMAPAVLRALSLASDNKCDIIFSPGCASFDEFKNFEHRGAVFSQMVKDSFDV